MRFRVGSAFAAPLILRSVIRTGTRRKDQGMQQVIIHGDEDEEADPAAGWPDPWGTAKRRLRRIDQSRWHRASARPERRKADTGHFGGQLRRRPPLLAR